MMKDTKADRAGDINHDAMILTSLAQLRLSVPVSAIPAPSSAPTTVCVPEIGIPEKEEVMMKMNEARQTLNIIFLYSSSVLRGNSGMISVAKVAAIASEQKKAPKNSAIAPMKTSLPRLIAFEPYEVASPLAASLLPIENDMRKLKTKVSISKMCIYLFY